MMKAHEIRKRFLDFFSTRHHARVKSDSLVPANDPTLLFTGAGMNQFKDYFLGIKHDLKRACSSQKCLRTGDLELVGQTPYHHTFFEMLGNFSFGDYFKREAIEWAWEFLTQELKMDPGRLRVSVHERDSEAYDIWRKHIRLDDAWIEKRGDDANFWPADAPKSGPNGPCGPCSEIYYDQGGDPASKSKTKPLSWSRDESGRFSEIWNLVFTQYDRQNDGSLNPLASKNIDTGAGLERLACMMQKKRMNFETDLFVPMLSSMEHALKIKINEDNQRIFYAIADHGRAATFAVTDGVFPSNEGRGYVIRKLIRRSVWRGKNLGCQEAFLHKIVPGVIHAMGDAYPEIAQSEKSVTQIIREEEERFLGTLERGLDLLSGLTEKAKKQGRKQIAGDDVFLLYDTYGFPDELTKLIAAREQLTIDQAGFDRLMDEQRQRAKDKSKIASSIFVADDMKNQLVKIQPTKFRGYETLKADGKVVWMSGSGAQIMIALDQTAFYPEGGGQVGDRGTISHPNWEFEVADTQKKENVILHVGKLTKGDAKVGDCATGIVNSALRDATKRNHTATHLLQAALRRVLGEHVRQLGSLVSPEKLRFDFSHGKALTKSELEQIEKEVNAIVVDNRPVEFRHEPYEQATKNGALAFFGEKYSDDVRVVEVSQFSKELCGGTHCQRTGDIGLFVITDERAVASGTRRIEAKTGLGALDYVRALQWQMDEMSALLKTTPDQLKSKVEKMQKDLKSGGSTSNSTMTDRSGEIKTMLQGARKISGAQLITHVFSNVELEELRHAWDVIRKQSAKSVVILFGSQNGKVTLLVGLTKDLLETKLDASQIAKVLAEKLDGSAGGRKELAQGGGKNPEALPDLVKSIPDFLQAMEH